jgi:hypothetical protein
MHECMSGSFESKEAIGRFQQPAKTGTPRSSRGADCLSKPQSEARGSLRHDRDRPAAGDVRRRRHRRGADHAPHAAGDRRPRAPVAARASRSGCSDYTVSLGRQQSSACPCWMGGQGTVPYEQNTQQSPGFGLSSVWHAGHRWKYWQAFVGIVSVVVPLQDGHFSVDCSLTFISEARSRKSGRGGRQPARWQSCRPSPETGGRRRRRSRMRAVDAAST